MVAPSDTLQPLLKKLGYRADFTATEKTAILRLPHKTRKLERHAYLVRQREKTTHACLLLSGYVIRHKIVATGTRQIIAVHMKGDLVDLHAAILGVADHGVQMISQGEVALIPTEPLKTLAFTYPKVGMAMWMDTLVDASIFAEWVANVGRRDARTRMAHLLCEFSLRLKVAGLGDTTDYKLPMTQAQIADCTGLTAVHVNRTLKYLEKENLISRRGHRSVTIGDWKKLAATGDFDSHYLHLREKEAALH